MRVAQGHGPVHVHDEVHVHGVDRAARAHLAHGPHAGDANSDRNGLDPLQLSQLHADLVFLFVGLTAGLLFAAYATNASPEVLSDLNKIPIRYANGATVYLGDVAFVHDGFSPQTNLVRRDGRHSALLPILSNGSASTLTVVEQARTIADALVGADVFVGLSQPGAVSVDGIRSMAKDAIVFAMANPTPEIMPDEEADDEEPCPTEPMTGLLCSSCQ